MRRTRIALGIITVLWFSASGARAALTFTNIIDPLNPTFTQALGVNNAGTVVGYGNPAIFNGFRTVPPFAPGSFSRENFPGAAGGTQVIGIGGSGATAGFYVLTTAMPPPANTTNGFLNVGGAFTTVDQPGSVFNQLLGINHAGTTAAGYASFGDPAGMTGQQAYTYSVATQTFTSINALLPANFNSQATGVNDAGTVVGFYQNDAAGDFSAFSDSAGIITSFQYPGSTSTQALGINDQGWIVGDYLSGGVMHGFVDIGGAFETIDPPGSTATTANGINDAGKVVGFYLDPNGNTIGFESLVPEPASLLLFGAGLAGLAVVRRRLRRG